MGTSMLSLVQQATGEMGVSVPSSVAGNLTQDVIQQLALLNSAGYELLRQYEWQALTIEYRFYTAFYQYTGTATGGTNTLTGMSSIANLDTTFTVTGTGIPQDTYVQSAVGATVTLTQNANLTSTGTYTFGKTKYAFPADYDRLIDRTDWDKSKHWEMLGPESAQQWQWLKSGYISTGPRIRFRPMGGYFQVFPLLSTNEYLGFEYLSKNWATNASGASQASFIADSDTCIWPDRLMVLGLKKKYFEAKGFDTASLQRDYDMQLDLAKAHDHGSPTLSLAPRLSNILIGWENIPDSNYGS
jgi:hypothetical protein